MGTGFKTGQVWKNLSQTCHRLRRTGWWRGCWMRKSEPCVLSLDPKQLCGSRQVTQLLQYLVTSLIKWKSWNRDSLRFFLAPRISYIETRWKQNHDGRPPHHTFCGPEAAWVIPRLRSCFIFLLHPPLFGYPQPPPLSSLPPSDGDGHQGRKERQQEHFQRVYPQNILQIPVCSLSLGNKDESSLRFPVSESNSMSVFANQNIELFPKDCFIRTNGWM